MDYYLVPVINGVLPRPGGGEVTGVFLDAFTARLLTEMGPDETVLLCPFDSASGRIYPVGVTTRLGEMWAQDVYIQGPNQKARALFARVAGVERVRSSRFEMQGRLLAAKQVKPLDLSELRSDGYPALDGAGWYPLGGFTDAKAPNDISVSIYGQEYESGRRVSVSAQLGGLVGLEQAHTIEHAIIRSLQRYAMCTSKTLAQAISEEATELRHSVEIGYKFNRPEIFGVTESGACGNPLTNLAQFYLANEMLKNLDEGHSVFESIDTARKKALSKLTEELDLTTDIGLRALQGLKNGMLHDDSPVAQKYLKRILSRFPESPWT